MKEKLIELGFVKNSWSDKYSVDDEFDTILIEDYILSLNEDSDIIVTYSYSLSFKTWVMDKGPIFIIKVLEAFTKINELTVERVAQLKEIFA